MSRQLILYYRSGCSLCEEMQQELFTSRTAYDFTLETRDVDADEGWRYCYGHKVPVLVGEEGEELCHYFLDSEVLTEYFSRG